MAINERQKAFLPVDGCYENINILQSIIKGRRAKRKELNIVMLDLAKAFDTVSHVTIVKALKRKCLLTMVIDVISNLWENETAKISTTKGETDSLKVKSGVKQGCPLSPLFL